VKVTVTARTQNTGRDDDGSKYTDFGSTPSK